MSAPGLFAQLLRDRRKALRLTQAELAERAGLSFSAVQKLEAGQRRPSHQLAEALADALRIAPKDRTRFLRLARGGGEEEESIPHNLPAQLTPLIGREQELASLTASLTGEGARLVTVMGPPGIGKTSLALRVAERLLESFPDGVFMVPLSPVREAAGVTRAIAATLGLRDTGHESLSISVRDYLRSKRMLLLLDNFEQVVSAATLVTDLLERCPNLKVLVTSREALRVRGERQVQVSPLATPSTTNPPPFDELLDYAAVRMFVERARDVAPRFSLTPENASPVAAVCAHLDGLPLAIELVAARTRLLPPQTLLARLEGRGSALGGGRESPLQVLAGGARDLPDRHRTLRNAIGWSYELLDRDERLLFNRLGAFVGGCSLSMAEAVCNAAGDLRMPVFELALSLLHKSLLKEEPGIERSVDEVEPRFSMLETVREYALEQLEQSGEAERVRQWHAEYFLALARATEPQLIGADQQTWLDRLERDHDNIRAALGWLVARGDLETAARLAGPLSRFWHVHGHLGEGRAWLEKLLCASLPPDVRAKLLSGAVSLARSQGDYDAARAMAEESLALCREEGDKGAIAAALKELGTVFDYQGDLEKAASLYRESLEAYRGLEDWWGVAASLNNLGILANIQGRRADALSLYGESLDLRRKIGDKRGVAGTLNNLGLTYYHEGDHETAVALWEESLALFEELKDEVAAADTLGHLGRAALLRGDYDRARQQLGRSLSISRSLGKKHGTALVLSYLSDAAFMEGDYDEARKLLKQCLVLLRDMSARVNMTEGLEYFAKIAAVTGEPERAARLYAAADAERKAAAIPCPPARLAELEHYQATARGLVSESAWEEAWREGQAMSLDEAVRYALAG